MDNVTIIVEDSTQDVLIEVVAGGIKGDKGDNAIQEDAFYLGSYATEATLTSAHPTAIDGNYAIVQATDTIWVWDISTSDWVDSGNELGSVPLNSVGVAELKPAFTRVINLGNVSGTVNLDFSLAVKYKLNMTANTTLTFSNVAYYVGIKTQQLEVTSNSDTYTLTHATGVDAARDLEDIDLDLTNYCTFFPHTATVFQSSVIAI